MIDPGLPLDPLLIAALLSVASAFAACAGLLILQLGLQRVFSIAPSLASAPRGDLPDTSLCVVIPAYNEADNIGPCLASVLASDPPCRDWQVLVVDDESSDATTDRVTALLHDRSASDPPCRLLRAGARPPAERWVGKNWACTRAMEEVSSNWVLFIDADVRLRPEAPVSYTHLTLPTR